MRYEKMRKMIRRMTAGVLTAFLLTGLAGCGAAGIAGPVTEEETDEQETGSAVDVGEQGVSEANWDKTAFEINGEPVSLREWNFYLRMNQMQWEKQYLEDYGDDMWSVETDDSGTTMADGLKKEVMEVICKTHILNQHAQEYNAELTAEEKAAVSERAESFMSAYHAALLDFAGADEEFVTEQLSATELSTKVEELAGKEYEPDIAEEDYQREGICYVLISTTGLRDADGNLTPFSDEEVQERTQMAKELSQKAKETGDLKSVAEEAGLRPIESSMGRSNEGDGQEPLMLDAARALAVGEGSDPIETEEGWFLVQHTSDYDESGTVYWKEYLTEQAQQSYAQEIYEQWRVDAQIVQNEEIMDSVIVKDVLKELL